jgi:ribosomal protein L40E
MDCPRCQYENPPPAKFCLECGSRLAPTCAQCGTALPAGAKFCLECGQPVGAPPGRSPSSHAYTPKHLAEKILTSKAALESERKQITVLFADLKGSMELPPRCESPCATWAARWSICSVQPGHFGAGMFVFQMSRWSFHCCPSRFQTTMYLPLSSVFPPSPVST